MSKIFNIKILFILTLFFFSNCFTPIKTLVRNPERFEAKKVKIRGTVVSSIELDDLSIFYLENMNSTIAVITEGYLPLKNEFIIVKGRFYADFQYHSKYNMPVVYEKIKIHDKRYKKTDYKYIDEKNFNPKDYP